MGSEANMERSDLDPRRRKILLLAEPRPFIYNSSVIEPTHVALWAYYIILDLPHSDLLLQLGSVRKDESFPSTVS